MTKMEAIIRPEKLHPLQEQLEELGLVGVTVTEVKGAGRQAGYVEQYRGLEYRARLLNKLKVEVVIPDPLVEEAIRVVRNACFTGDVGDGKVFLSKIDDAVRIRTGDRGNQAL
jgi:nitrogen regulatory protein PII